MSLPAQLELRDVVTKAKHPMKLRPYDTVEVVRLDSRKFQYLYTEGAYGVPRQGEAWPSCSQLPWHSAAVLEPVHRPASAVVLCCLPPQHTVSLDTVGTAGFLQVACFTAWTQGHLSRWVMHGAAWCCILLQCLRGRRALGLKRARVAHDQSGGASAR